METRITNIKEKNNPLANSRNITFIEAPSAYKSTTALKKALVKQPLFTLFLENGTEELPHDINKQTIPPSGLVCFDASVYFDPLFSGEKTILYAGPNNTKIAIEHSSCILIFANKLKEVNTIFAGIQAVMGYHPLPAILLATTLDADIRHTKIDIAGVIDTHDTTTLNAAAFWVRVRDAVDKLPDSNLTQTEYTVRV